MTENRSHPEALSESAAHTTQRIIGCAESFIHHHREDPAIHSTFGYFTHHPVSPLNQKRLQALLTVTGQRSAELGRPLRILDLACGGGLVTCAFAAMGHRTLGIDLNPQEIRMAKLFAQEEKLDGMFLQTNLLEDVQWERASEEILGGKPDIVNLAYALHHLPEVTPLLKRLGRWMEPASQLLINEENPDSPLFQLKHWARDWIQKDTDQEWHRSFSEWKRLIEAHGFHVQPSLIGLDPIAFLARVKPGKCWSLVFTAQRD